MSHWNLLQFFFFLSFFLSLKGVVRMLMQKCFDKAGVLQCARYLCVILKDNATKINQKQKIIISLCVESQNNTKPW